MLYLCADVIISQGLRHCVIHRYKYAKTVFVK